MYPGGQDTDKGRADRLLYRPSQLSLGIQSLLFPSSLMVLTYVIAGNFPFINSH